MNNLNGQNIENVFDITKFGINLARLRKMHDMTQSELADRLNLTRQAVSRYENGDSFPDISILVILCEIFNVALEDLIGVKSNGQKQIIKQISRGEDVKLDNESTIEDLINLAPILKPSILEKAVSNFKDQGINIEAITKLVQYINDRSLYQLLANANYEQPSMELLSVLLPYMDDDSKWEVFAKILEGKVDYRFLEEFIPACTWVDISLVEAAVVEGALDVEALVYMQKGAAERYRRLYNSKV